uniref:Ig-like domain-containing protein n=1 Tax=Amphilophus citrinellus TaxID=61819 RepID=A0A3Q0S550_AMPCI
ITEHRGTLCTEQPLNMMRMRNLIQSLLLIIVLVSTVGAQEVIYAKVGEQVTLVPKSNQRQYVYWHLGNQNGPQLAWLNHLGGKGINEKWKSRLSLQDASLVINDIQQEFFGTFVCKMTSSGKPDSITEYKIIQIIGKLDVKPDTLLLHGDILSLTCNLERTPQVQNKPSIYWLNPQGVRERNNQGKVNVPATSDHNGQWSCVVKDNNNEKKVHVPVGVVGEFLCICTFAFVLQWYTSLTIPCSINSGVTWEQILTKELEEVWWDFVPKLSSGAVSVNRERLFDFNVEKRSLTPGQKKGLRLVSSNKKENLSLTKSKGSVEDRGHYNCSMKFKNGRTLSNTVDLDVLQITSQPGKELIYGQQVNLSCSTGDPLPNDVMLNWTKPETSSRYVQYPTHITIPEVRKGDSGKWRCELWQRGKRLTSAEILLKTETWFYMMCSFYTVYCLMIVSVAYRTPTKRVDAGDHLQCGSHPSPPPRACFHPLPTQKSTVQPFLFLSFQSH